MKKLILLAFVLFLTKNYSQISSNNSKNHISVVVAPFSDSVGRGFDSNTQYASDFYILDFDSSDASLNTTYNKKSSYKKSDQNFELEIARVAKKYSGKMLASLFLKDGAFDYESLVVKGLDQLTEDQRAGYSANLTGLETTARDRLIYPMVVFLHYTLLPIKEYLCQACSRPPMIHIYSFQILGQKDQS